VGRVLFYDKRLSANDTVYCAIFYKQENAFADANTLSDCINGQKTHRNRLSLTNIAFSGKGKLF